MAVNNFNKTESIVQEQRSDLGIGELRVEGAASLQWASLWEQNRRERVLNRMAKFITKFNSFKINL